MSIWQSLVRLFKRPQRSTVVCQCGQKCDAETKFCPQCGHKLTATSLKTVVTEDQKTGVTEDIHKLKTTVSSSFESERKHVTMLFADLKGSTALIQHLDPEEATNILRPALNEMLKAVFSYDGTVIHTAGDGIVAIFGAPKPLEDHALRACLAAQAMQERIPAVNTDLRTRIGLNSGEVLLEVIGDKQHREYDATGSVVNLAARMEQTAQPNTIQITKHTFELVKHNVNAESLGKVEVKGFPKPVDVFILKSFKKMKSLARTKKRINTPFVGREKEMNQIINLLKSAKTGKGEIIDIKAEAGQGKSRIIYEFAHKEELADCLLLMISGFSHTSNITLFPITRLFRDLFKIKDLKNSEDIKLKIQPFLSTIELPQAFNSALALIQAPIKDADWQKLDPLLKRKYMFNVGIQILLQLSTQKPIVLIIEDMHWVDNDSEAFFNLLLPQISQSSILTVTSYRPTYVSPWSHLTNYVQIVLNSLPLEAGQELLNSLLGMDSSLADFKLKLAKDCNGNPFFLEETIKNLISDNILVKKDDKSYCLNIKMLVNEIKLPESIFAVLQAQIDKMPAENKKILQIAAVIGQEFTYQILSKLCDIMQNELRETLNELDEHYIYETQIYPEPKYAFKHAYFQEVIYKNMLKRNRKIIHTKIFNVMKDTISEDSPLDDLQLIAEHAYSSESWADALKYCYLAGEHLFLTNALKSSIQVYNKALTAAEHLPKDTTTLNASINIHMELILAYIRLRDAENTKLHHQKATELVSLNKNFFLQNVLKTVEANQAFIFGHNHHALEIIQNIDNKNLNQDQLHTIEVMRNRILANIYLMLGQNDKLIEATNIVLKLIPNYNYFTIYTKLPHGHMTLSYLFMGLSYAGQFDKLTDKLKLWLHSENIDEPNMASYFITLSIGLYHYLKGEYDEAIDLLKKSIKISYEIETLFPVPITTAALGLIYIESNKVEEGKAYIYQALEMGTKSNFFYLSAFAMGSIAKGLLLLGEIDHAKQFLDQAFKIIDEREMEGQKVELLRIQAEIDLACPQPDFTDIKQKLDKSFALAVKLDMPAQIAHYHFVLAKLYEKMNDEESFHFALANSIQSYTTLNMPFWIKECQKLRNTYVSHAKIR